MEGPIFYLLHRPTISSDFGYLVHFEEVYVMKVTVNAVPSNIWQRRELLNSSICRI